MSQPTCTFCGIFNDTPATRIIHDPEGVDTPVCAICASVFEYGQVCPKATISIIEPDIEPDKPDNEPTDISDDLCDICRRSGVEISHIDDMGNAVCYECTGVGDE